MPMFKILIRDRPTQHEKITVFGGPCTPKEAYDYGKALGISILSLNGESEGVHVEIEEQPA